MKKIKAHANQIVNHSHQLTDGNGHFIHLKYHRNLNEVLAYKATLNYFDESRSIDVEKDVPVHEALKGWHSPISENAHGIDGILAILCPDNIWRKLVWFNKDKVGQAFTTGNYEYWEPEIFQNEKKTPDYILVKDGVPVETPDIIYAAESVIELFNGGFTLKNGETFEVYNPSTT